MYLRTYALSAKYTTEGAVFWARFADRIFWLNRECLGAHFCFNIIVNPEGLQVLYEEKL